MARYKPAVEINLQAITHNVAYIRSIVSSQSLLLAVVKCDAYSHGWPAIRELNRIGVDWFGVADVEEAARIREFSEKPILILEPVPPCHFKDVVDKKATMTINNRKTLDHLLQYFKTTGNRIPCHLYVNTGKNDYGVNPSEVREILKIAQSNGSFVSGLFTHFSVSATEMACEHQTQVSRFSSALNNANEYQGNLLVHCASSSDLLNGDLHFGMVRVGAAIYGIEAQLECHTLPAMSVRTFINEVRDDFVGEFVGYIDKSSPQRKARRIAIIDLGYSSGLRRDISFCGNGSVLLHGTRCPFVHKASMDAIAIDVSHLPDVQCWEKVVVIGNDGNEEATASELAKSLGTIPYELVTQLGKSPNHKIV